MREVLSNKRKLPVGCDRCSATTTLNALSSCRRVSRQKADSLNSSFRRLLVGHSSSFKRMTSSSTSVYCRSSLRLYGRDDLCPAVFYTSVAWSHPKTTRLCQVSPILFIWTYCSNQGHNQAPRDLVQYRPSPSFLFLLPHHSFSTALSPSSSRSKPFKSS